jgi:hypothetical protein
MTRTLLGIVPSIMKIQNTNNDFLNIKDAPPALVGAYRNTPLQGFLTSTSPAAGPHDIVAKIRTLLRIQKVGHAGTLIRWRRAYSQFVSARDKSRGVPARVGQGIPGGPALGWETDTLDATGKILAGRSAGFRKTSSVPHWPGSSAGSSRPLNVLSY